MFMGKTVLENYNEGAYIGVYYGGEDIFKKMGILGDENYLKQTGFNSQDELINHLKTNGLVVQAHRSPTIYTSSISPSIIYYNDRIKGNEVMTTIEEVLGKNGDFDGDNGMFSVIRDESGRDSVQSGGEGKLWKDIQAEQVYRARTEGAYYHDKAVNIYIKDYDNIKEKLNRQTSYIEEVKKDRNNLLDFSLRLKNKLNVFSNTEALEKIQKLLDKQ